MASAAHHFHLPVSASFSSIPTRISRKRSQRYLLPGILAFRDRLLLSAGEGGGESGPQLMGTGRYGHPGTSAFRTDDSERLNFHSNVNRRPTNDELRTAARSRSTSYQESCRVTKGVPLRSGGAGGFTASAGVAF